MSGAGHGAGGPGPLLGVERILVAHAFTPACEQALAWALGLAAGLGGTVEAVHVVNTAALDALFGPPDPKLWEEALAHATRRLAEVAAAAAHPALTHKVLEGPAASVIVDHATATRADLIVVGTAGRSGLGRVLMGSVAERVVRTATCPVLVVRSDPPLRTPAPSSPD